MTGKARIAHLAGPNATIQNTPPLVTSNKARAKHGLSLLTHTDGSPARFDVLRPQRLAAPVRVYVEQFSAHPLEADAAELYGPPDGYIDSAGHVHQERQSAGDKRSTKWNCVPRTGFTRCPTWPHRRMVPPGRRNVRSPVLPRPRRDRASSRTARAASRKSTGCRSASTAPGT